jgi:hypothetical protein
VAWHQVPASSLPNDDMTLARMLGFGRDLRGWKRIREAGGLRGWELHSDGRLYHPVVSARAMEAVQMKKSQSQRTEAARLAALARKSGLHALSQEQSQALSRGLSQTEKPSVTDPVTGSNRTEQNRTEVSVAVAPEPDDDDQTMKFIRSLGGHLTFRDEDKRPDWRVHVEGLTLEQIREVFDWGRAHGAIVTLPGKGPGYFGGVRTAMRAAARTAAEAARHQAEEAARAEQERNERSGKQAEARAKEQANRAKVAGVLAVFDENPTRWLNELATAECNALAGIREAFNKRRPLALHMRHLDALPAALVEAGSARAPEFIEATEGATT